MFDRKNNKQRLSLVHHRVAQRISERFPSSSLPVNVETASEDLRLAAHDFEKIYSVKKNVESRLLAIPGVHGVGLGAKYIGGERTHEPAIMVFLENKKPAIAIPSHEMIPAQIDGVKTDVIESTPPR